MLSLSFPEPSRRHSYLTGVVVQERGVSSATLTEFLHQQQKIMDFNMAAEQVPGLAECNIRRITM